MPEPIEVSGSFLIPQRSQTSSRTCRGPGSDLVPRGSQTHVQSFVLDMVFLPITAISCGAVLKFQRVENSAPSGKGRRGGLVSLAYNDDYFLHFNLQNWSVNDTKNLYRYFLLLTLHSVSMTLWNIASKWSITLEFSSSASQREKDFHFFVVVFCGPRDHTQGLAHT